MINENNIFILETIKKISYPSIYQYVGANVLIIISILIKNNNFKILRNKNYFHALNKFYLVIYLEKYHTIISEIK